MNTQTIKDYFSTSAPSTPPNRVQTYLTHEGKSSRLPFSCTLLVVKDVIDTLIFATRSLKSGAGVKLIFDRDFDLPDAPATLPRYSVYLEPSHSDWQFSNEAQIVNHRGSGRVVAVDDSIEGVNGIMQSWRYFWDELEKGHEVVVDLSKLRPRDSINESGLVASGPVFFAHMYHALFYHFKYRTVHSLLKLLGTLNMVVLRGGYKRGIITSSMHCECPLFKKYLEVPLVSIPGSHKKGAIVNDKVSPELIDLICYKINSESLFLQKEQSDPELFANVCMGIFLRDRGTCLIWRVNLGACHDDFDILMAFEDATKQAIELTYEWRQKTPQHCWADLKDDLQVAIDVMGLANLLAARHLSYDDLIEGINYDTGSAKNLIATLRTAYIHSVLVADATCDKLGIPHFERLHCVEPAQAHSYRTVDVNGYTTCRGIWPPFDRFVNRLSNTQEVITVDHGPVQIASDVGPEKHMEVCSAWQSLFKRPHAISYDTWKQFDAAEYRRWWESGLQTVYYNFSNGYSQDYSRKVVTHVTLCSVCEE